VNILALDTATVLFSVALGSDMGNWYFEVDAGQRHSELLMDVIDLLMKSAGLKPGDVNLVVCMKGPGSFTGLRIGFAAAKGLALSLDIPLLAIPTLDCMAFPFKPWPGIVMPVIDAKKHCYFTALYRRTERISDYVDAEPRTIAKMITYAAGEHELVLLTGPDAVMLQSALAGTCGSPDILRLDPRHRKGWARELLELAQIELAQKGGVCQLDDHELFAGPLYLRKSDAELNLKV
jgi:tRNA threonylcarbamoyladenosine biosynthesis protein TsaB